MINLNENHKRRKMFEQLKKEGRALAREELMKKLFASVVIGIFIGAVAFASLSATASTLFTMGV